MFHRCPMLRSGSNREDRQNKPLVVAQIGVYFQNKQLEDILFTAYVWRIMSFKWPPPLHYIPQLLNEHLPLLSSKILDKVRYALSIAAFQVSQCLWVLPIRPFFQEPQTNDRLCGLVVRVPCYRSRGPGFDSRRYQIF
jgi:hypothetical protein